MLRCIVTLIEVNLEVVVTWKVDVMVEVTTVVQNVSPRSEGVLVLQHRRDIIMMRPHDVACGGPCGIAHGTPFL